MAPAPRPSPPQAVLAGGPGRRPAHVEATGAVAGVVCHGFEERGLLRVRANRFGSNRGSGRVLRKVGMVHLRARPGHYEKRGEVENREEYCLLARDWRKVRGT